MNIVDYCAEKAYNVYSQRYIVDNQDKLDDIEKLDFKQKQDFIPQFTIDLKKNIANFLDDYTEDKDIVRKSLTQILKNNFDNLQQNNIIDLSGRINVNAITANLNQGVKESLPDIYEKVQNVKQSKEALDKNSSKTSVDFNDPEERKEYFQNLFTEYTNLKTFNEKLDFYCKNVEDISALSLEDQKIRLNQYEIGYEIEKRFDRIENDNPEATEDELRTKNNEELKKMADEKNCSVEQLKLIYDRKKLVELISIEPDSLKKSEYQKNLAELDQYLNSFSNIEITKGDNEIIDKANIMSQDLFNNYFEEIDFVDIPLENADALFEELIPENSLLDESNDEFLFPELEENFILPELEENEPEEDLTYLFGNIDIEPEDTSLDAILTGDVEKITETDLSSEIIQEENKVELPNPTENTYKNSILSGVQIPAEDLETPLEYETEVMENPILKFLKNIRNRFTQARLEPGQPTQNHSIDFKKENSVSETDLKSEDYTQNIEEKQGFFTKIKNTALKFIGRNKVPATPAIDTAENNTYEETMSAFDSSLIVTEEEQEKNGALYAQQKKEQEQKRKSSSTIQVDGTSRTS